MKFPPIDIPGQGELHASLHTSKGKMVARLHEKGAPNTVKNFVGLARGVIDWVDPKTKKTVKGVPFYDGLLVHRIVRNFVIQVGDPKTRYSELEAEWGTGDPGYKFRDEFDPALRHNRAGMLSMANSGPNSNGSQFFVTEVPTPHLDKRHSVFGQLITGLDVIKEIANAPTDDRGRPNPPIYLEKVEIFRQ